MGAMTVGQGVCGVCVCVVGRVWGSSGWSGSLGVLAFHRVCVCI